MAAAKHSVHLIDRVTLERLSRRSATRWLVAATFEWGAIFGLMWLCNAWPNPLLWITAIFLIGSRQHALGVLAHDGAHFLICRSRRWNDRLCNYLAAYPLFFPVQGYRTQHLKHHRLLDTPRDPERLAIDTYPTEFNFPMPAKQLYWLLLRDLIGGSIKPISTMIDYAWTMSVGKSQHIRRLVGYHVAVAALALITGYLLTYLLLWIIPTFTSLCFFLRVHTILEHAGIGPPHKRFQRDSIDPVATTRTFLSGPIVRYLFSPYNVSYHTEHHLYPSVPGFRLKYVRDRLLENEAFSTRSHVTRGLVALIRELSSVNRLGDTS